MREYEIDGEQFSTLEELSALLEVILDRRRAVAEGHRLGGGRVA